MLIVPITTGTEIIDPFWPFRENDTQIVLVIEMGVCGSLALTEAIAPKFSLFRILPDRYCGCAGSGVNKGTALAIHFVECQAWGGAD